MRIIILGFYTLMLSGCGFTPFLYKADIVQGNIFNAAEVARIQPGMSREAVERILGTPQLSDPFHNNRSDYLYRYFAGESGRTYSHGVSVYYNQAGLVTRIETQPATVSQ